MPLLITSKPIALNKSPAAPCKKLPQFIYFLPFYFFTFLPLKLFQRFCLQAYNVACHGVEDDVRRDFLSEESAAQQFHATILGSVGRILSHGAAVVHDVYLYFSRQANPDHKVVFLFLFVACCLYLINDVLVLNDSIIGSAREVVVVGQAEMA